MRATPFRIGLALAVAGAIWTGVLFSGADRAGASYVLAPSESAEIAADLEGPSLGYYTVHMPAFSGEEVFVQVTDPRGNVVQEGLVKTRMSVGYFDYGDSGAHTARISNVSDRAIPVDVEIGGADSRGMIPGGTVMIAGVILMMAAAYVRLRDYSTAQPDENIS